MAGPGRLLAWLAASAGKWLRSRIPQGRLTPCQRPPVKKLLTSLGSIVGCGHFSTTPPCKLAFFGSPALVAGLSFGLSQPANCGPGWRGVEFS